VTYARIFDAGDTISTYWILCSSRLLRITPLRLGATRVFQCPKCTSCTKVVVRRSFMIGRIRHYSKRPCFLRKLPTLSIFLTIPHNFAKASRSQPRLACVASFIIAHILIFVYPHPPSRHSSQDDLLSQRPCRLAPGIMLCSCLGR
jgi:hypothetical protein